MFAKWFGRLFLVVSFILLSSIFTTYAYSSEVVIFAVNKNLQMHPKDPIFKDYYLSGGIEDGLRRGMIVTVVRRTPVHDLSRNRALGDILLPVAKLRLIYVQKNLSIARVVTLIHGKSIPNTEFDAVMVGDRVTLTDGFEGQGNEDLDLEGAGTGGDEGKKPEEKKGVPESIETKVESVDANIPKALPEKSEAKPVISARVPSSEEVQPQKTPAHAEKEKNSLKTPSKPDNHSESVKLGPAA